VGGETAPVSFYLPASRSGIAWLLDPMSPGLGELAREVLGRTPSSPCDATALRADVDGLRALIAERHFGVATGRVAAPAASLDAWQRTLDDRPRTWGDAVADLQANLRAELGDQHVLVPGAPPQTPAVGPTVEERVVDGILVLLVRRLYGDREAEEALVEWVAAADRHFAHDRIVLDLRGNGGGNDGHTWNWVRRRLRPVRDYGSDSTWVVRGKPLGSWNTIAWREARDGSESLAPSHRAARHDPRPGDQIELEEERFDLPAGDLEWQGQMLVLTDRDTRSSGESSAWLLKRGLGARLLGAPTTGMIEYGNVAVYAFERSGLVIHLPTKHNDFGFPVESVGFPVDAPLGPEVSADDVARDFDAFV
jgi:hypothetical protein